MHSGLSGRRMWQAAATVWLAIIAVSIESLGINVMLPAVATEFRISAADSIWVVAAYQFGILFTLLPCSALGEVVGYRRVSQIGLVVYAIGAVGCLISSTFPLLVLARFVQGLGMSGVVSVNSALLRHIFPAERLARAFSYNAFLIGLFGAAGPTIVSVMISFGSWRWVYVLSTPICFAALLLGRRSLPDNERSSGFAWQHALLYCGTVAGLFAGSMASRMKHGVMSALFFGAGLMIGLRLIVASLPLERPLLPVDLLRSRIFLISLFTSACCFTSQALAFVALPFFLLHQLLRPTMEVGALLMSWPIALAVAAPLAGRIAGKISTPILAGCGLLLMSAGLALTSRLGPASEPVDIMWRLSLCGFGFGFFQTPNNHMLLTSAPLDRAGGANGLQAIARHTGQITGASIAALIFIILPHREDIAILTAGLITLIAAGSSFSRRLIMNDVR